MDCISVVAQRPAGDTILMGSNSEYLYDTVHTYGAYLPTHMYNTSDSNFPFLIFLDNIWSLYYSSILRYFWNTLGYATLDSATILNYLHEYPNLSNLNTGRHITGCQFAAPDDDIVVKGLAVCPIIINTEQLLDCAVDYRWRGYGIDTAARYVIDTTLASRETEYVQLYTIEGGGSRSFRRKAGGVSSTRTATCFSQEATSPRTIQRCHPATTQWPYPFTRRCLTQAY